MNTNSLRHRCFRRRAQQPTIAVERADRLASLCSDLTSTARRLSIVVAEREAATVLPGPAHALLQDGCGALDRVAELPELARRAIRHAARPAGVGVVAQADMLASVAAELAGVLRGGEVGFRDEAAGLGRDLGVGLGALACLGPNETDMSLILAAETLSLAARLVLVLARLRPGRDRVCRVLHAFRGRAARWAAVWAVRVLSLPLSTDLVHLWPTTPIAVWAAVVLAALVGRFAAFRPLGVLADLLSVVTSVALLHPALVAVALADVLTGNRPCRLQGRALRRVVRLSLGCVGVISYRPPPRQRDHREHNRDQ